MGDAKRKVPRTELTTQIGRLVAQCPEEAAAALHRVEQACSEGAARHIHWLVQRELVAAREAHDPQSEAAERWQGWIDSWAARRTSWIVHSTPTRLLRVRLGALIHPENDLTPNVRSDWEAVMVYSLVTLESIEGVSLPVSLAAWEGDRGRKHVGMVCRNLSGKGWKRLQVRVEKAVARLVSRSPAARCNDLLNSLGELQQLHFGLGMLYADTSDATMLPADVRMAVARRSSELVATISNIWPNTDSVALASRDATFAPLAAEISAIEAGRAGDAVERKKVLGAAMGVIETFVKPIAAWVALPAQVREATVRADPPGEVWRDSAWFEKVTKEGCKSTGAVLRTSELRREADTNPAIRSRLIQGRKRHREFEATSVCACSRFAMFAAVLQAAIDNQADPKRRVPRAPRTAANETASLAAHKS